MKKLAIILLIIFTAGTVSAQETSSRRAAHFNIAKTGLAIKGFDPVSYHQGQARKGNEQIATTHNGLQYRFISEANRTVFLADPAKYEPAYGGWCAWAMLEGDKVDIDPQRYKIINGQTYLFYDGFFGNTLEKWNKKATKIPEAELVKKADQHWIKIIQ